MIGFLSKALQQLPVTPSTTPTPVSTMLSLYLSSLLSPISASCFIHILHFTEIKFYRFDVGTITSTCPPLWLIPPLIIVGTRWSDCLYEMSLKMSSLECCVSTGLGDAHDAASCEDLLVSPVTVLSFSSDLASLASLFHVLPWYYLPTTVPFQYLVCCLLPHSLPDSLLLGLARGPMWISSLSSVYILIKASPEPWI